MEDPALATREEKNWQHVREDAALRKARNQNPQPKKVHRQERVRRKDWTGAFEEDPEGHDSLPERERVMPKGEIQWRQAKIIRFPLHQGFGPTGVEPGGDRRDGQAVAQGTVFEVSSDLCRVQVGERAFLCQLRNALRVAHSGYSNIVAVGDHVTISHDGEGRGTVEAILPRRSALARPDPFNVYRQQVIVANVDQMLIVAAWREPAFWPELVDRYLIAALRYNLAPVMAINKVDLAEDAEELATAVAAYRAAGCRTILTSALTGAGLDELRGVLTGTTTVLTGLSGVGKSSLLAAVEPGLRLRVAAVSGRKHEGRHTTTQVTLHPMIAGGFVADTPGIREFGLAGLKQTELRGFYGEFAAAGPCEFANCTHTREPGCAVKAAVRAGSIARLRYDSYRKIWRALAA